MKVLYIIFLIFIFCFLPLSSQAWEPASYIINGTFDVSQNKNWFDQNDLYYYNRELWDDVREPFQSIKNDGGYKKFFKDEFFGRRVVPNLLLHTIGGSYDAIYFEKYFSKQEYSYPFLFMSLTYYLARWGNEVIEVSHNSLDSHDHIADIYFFDPLGLLLSQSGWWKNFLKKDLDMKAWHSIPYYQFADQEVVNAGLNYIIRPYSLNITSNLRPFFYFGMQNILGLSYRIGPSEFSIGTGVFYTDPLNNKSKLVGAMFYERNEELGMSLFINGSEEMKWRVNIYPHFVELMRKYHLGFLLGETSGKDKNQAFLGVITKLPIGALLD